MVQKERWGGIKVKKGWWEVSRFRRDGGRYQGLEGEVRRS